MKKSERQLEDLRLALDEIADPIKYLKLEAEKVGAKINGFAFELAKDADYLKDIAKKALEKLNSETDVKLKPNDLTTAKKFFIDNNFEYFTPEQLNVIGHTMRDYAEFLQAE